MRHWPRTLREIARTRVHERCLNRGANDARPGALCDAVERRTELVVPVSDEEPRPLSEGCRVAQLLRRPLPGGRSRHRQVDDAPGLGIVQVQAIVEGCRNDRTVAPDDELHDDPSAEGGASAEGALVARAHATERGPDDALDLEWLDASEVVVDGLAALKCRLRRHEHPDRHGARRRRSPRRGLPRTRRPAARRWPAAGTPLSHAHERALHERRSLSAHPVPDCQHLDDLAGDPVVDVVARSPHEDAAHPAQIVVVGGPAERWRVGDQRHCFFELPQEQVRCGATVCPPPPVNRSRVLGCARVKSDVHSRRLLRAQASKDLGTRYELSAIGACEASLQLLALLGGQVPRLVLHRLKLDLSPFGQVGRLVHDEPAVPYPSAYRHHGRRIAPVGSLTGPARFVQQAATRQRRVQPTACSRGCLQS